MSLSKSFWQVIWSETVSCAQQELEYHSLVCSFVLSKCQDISLLQKRIWKFKMNIWELLLLITRYVFHPITAVILVHIHYIIYIISHSHVINIVVRPDMSHNNSNNQISTASMMTPQKRQTDSCMYFPLTGNISFIIPILYSQFINFYFSQTKAWVITVSIILMTMNTVLLLALALNSLAVVCLT